MADGRLSPADDALDLLVDLERQTPEEVRRQRSSHRLQIQARVVVQPGNSSEMLRFRVQAVTADISAGGCQILSPIPLQVGDIYRLRFDPQDLDLPLLFVRCLRCRLIREDAYEVGFQFFKEIALPDARSAARAEGGLLADATPGG